MSVIIKNAPTCPSCGTLLNAAQETSGGPRVYPRSGDVTVCCHCATVSKYHEKPDGTLGLNALSDEQITELPVYLHEPLKQARTFLLSKMN